MANTKKNKKSVGTGTSNTTNGSIMSDNPSSIIQGESAENNQLIFQKYIGVGRKNAISMRDLSKKTHTDSRQLRKCIVSARLKGDLIIGDVRCGYYRHETVEELIQWFQTSYKRAMTTLSYLKYARKIILDHGYRIDGFGNVTRKKEDDNG